jgi:hypothetical protein
MRAFGIFCAIILGVMSLAPQDLSARVQVGCTVGDDGMFRDKDVDLDFDHGSIIFKHDDGNSTVEITKDYALIVNGTELHLRSDQRGLVKDYYESFHAVLDDASAVALAGIKLGAKGLAVGLVAACRALCGGADVDVDHHDHKLDRETSKMNAEGAKIEKRAERLKRKAETLVKLHEKLRRNVTELDQLGWF